MTPAEIENLSFTELKSQHDELVEKAKARPPEELATRYIQARTDAKQRDEMLAKQAKTITALQDGAAATKHQAEASAAELVKCQEASAAELVKCHTTIETYKASLDAACESARQTGLADKAALAAATESLQQETARATRLKTVAMSSHNALSAAAKLLNDALATQAVAHADTGE